MAISRVAVVMLGTDDSTGVTIATTATSADTEVDVIGDNATLAYGDVYFRYTSTVTAGTLDVELHHHRISGQDYLNQLPVELKRSFVPVNGTEKILAFRHVPLSRYMSVTVKNNATGANATNVFVGIEVYKVT